MFLARLWSEYLSKTRPIPTVLSGPLIVFQMLGGLLPLIGLYRAVRRENPAERVLLCMVPGIFVVTAAFIEPLFFGSFLGEGFPWTEALGQFLAQAPFFREVLALVGVFFGALLTERMLDRLWGRPFFAGFFRSAGLELPIALALLALCADYIWGRGRLFAALGGQEVKWLVYGVYLLLYKDCVLLVCLVWRLLFSEWRQGEEDDGKWLRRYLARGYRAYGWALLLFAGLWAFAVVGGLKREGSPYIWALAVNLAIGALAVLSLARSWRPPDYRRILSWGEPEQILRQLRQEIEKKPPLVRTDLGFLTEHYLVLFRSRRIFCRRLLDKEASRLQAGVWLLRFQDGGKCRINAAYRRLLDPLCPQGRTAKQRGWEEPRP